MNKKIKQIAAIACVVLLVGLYVWSLVAAILSRPEADGMFRAAITCTFFIPVMIYVYTLMAKVLRGRGANKQAQIEEERKDDKIGEAE
ncbi:MAG: hypothetical protein GX225_04785 [Clostridiales bacterium]|nr:hypothetical protein [Clostridiales bacterium]